MSKFVFFFTFFSFQFLTSDYARKNSQVLKLVKKKQCRHVTLIFVSIIYNELRRAMRCCLLFFFCFNKQSKSLCVLPEVLVPIGWGVTTTAEHIEETLFLSSLIESLRLRNVLVRVIIYQYEGERRKNKRLKNCLS